MDILLNNQQSSVPLHEAILLTFPETGRNRSFNLATDAFYLFSNDTVPACMSPISCQKLQYKSVNIIAELQDEIHL